jgi:hypothetical protein
MRNWLWLLVFVLTCGKEVAALSGSSCTLVKSSSCTKIALNQSDYGVFALGANTIFYSPFFRPLFVFS